MDRVEGLSFSVRLAMCPVERERDPPGCRASGLTPELPFIGVLVPPLLVLLPLRHQALVPMVQRQPHRVCYFLDCPRKFRLRPLWWLRKSSGFNSGKWSSRLFFTRFFAAPEAYTRGRLSDGYITMKLNKTPFNCSRHN